MNNPLLYLDKGTKDHYIIVNLEAGNCLQWPYQCDLQDAPITDQILEVYGFERINPFIWQNKKYGIWMEQTDKGIYRPSFATWESPCKIGTADQLGGLMNILTPDEYPIHHLIDPKEWTKDMVNDLGVDTTIWKGNQYEWDGEEMKKK